MPAISKPDLSLIWASAGDVLKPSDSKIQTGWTAEIPPRQWFNWYQNRADSALAHINQYGIGLWDTKTEYQAGYSLVMGSNGVIYRSVTTSTNVNPVNDSTGAWKQAFNTFTAATQAQAQAHTDASSTISPLTLEQAYKGSANQLLAVNGFQYHPGGLIEVWGQVTLSVASDMGSTASQTVNFAKTFPNQILNFTVTNVNGAGGGADFIECITGVTSFTNSSAVITSKRVAGSNVGGETIIVNYNFKGF